MAMMNKETKDRQLIPLSMAKTGQKVRLVSIDAGSALNNRLAAMGLVPDVEIIVVENNLPGPFVIIVKTTRLVLGKGMVNKITVS